MTKSLQLNRFCRTLAGALLAFAFIVGLAGLSGLSSVDLAVLIESPDSALTVAQK